MTTLVVSCLWSFRDVLLWLRGGVGARPWGWQHMPGYAYQRAGALGATGGLSTGMQSPADARSLAASPTAMLLGQASTGRVPVPTPVQPMHVNPAAASSLFDADGGGGISVPAGSITPGTSTTWAATPRTHSETLLARAQANQRKQMALEPLQMRVQEQQHSQQKEYSRMASASKLSQPFIVESQQP